MGFLLVISWLGGRGRGGHRPRLCDGDRARSSSPLFEAHHRYSELIMSVSSFFEAYHRYLKLIVVVESS